MERLASGQPVNFTDSHAHLGMPAFAPDLPDVLIRARAAGVTRILNIALGPDPEELDRACELSTSTEGVATAVGVHPHEARRMTDSTLDELRRLTKRFKVAALGEIGLDFHYLHSPRDVQLLRFGQLLDLALDLGLPVIVHSREATEETHREVSSRKIFERVGGVLHCFSGTQDEAKRFLDLGAHVSFTGIITFKKAEALREVVRFVPLDRLLIETDAPYLAPEPNRGKRNEPAYVVQVAQAVADAKGLPLADVARITAENAARLFRLTP
jgi:TatD DNase family protein